MLPHYSLANIYIYQMQELACILALCPVLSGVGSGLERIASQALEVPVDSELNDVAAKAFGACTKVLASLTEYQINEDIGSWITRAVKQWPQSIIVLDGVYAIASRYVNIHLLPRVLTNARLQCNLWTEDTFDGTLSISPEIDTQCTT